MKKGKYFVLAFILGISIVFLGFSFPSRVKADEPKTLVLYWLMGKETLQYRGLTIFMDGVERRTNGQVKFKRYCCGSLGKETETLENLRAGSIDFKCSGIGWWARYHKPIDMIQLPFLFRDYDHVYKSAISPLYEKLTKGLEKYNMKPIMQFNAGFKDLSNSIKPIHSLDDVPKGLKIRVPPMPMNLAAWKAFGASPVSMKPVELYMALKTGVVDAQENGPNNTKDMKLYECQKYFSYIKYAWMGPLLVMNLNRWNSLTPDIQKIIKEEAMKGAKWTFEQGKKANDDALRWMEKEKGLIVDWNPDRESFKRAAVKVYRGCEKEPWYDAELVKAIEALK